MFESLVKWVLPTYYDEQLEGAVDARDVSGISNAMAQDANPYRRNRSGYSSLTKAVSSGNEDILKAIIHHKNFVFKEESIEEIRVAIEAGNLHLVPLLIMEHNAHTLNKYAHEGMTVYTMAKLKGYDEVANLLLAHGASKNLHEKYMKDLNRKKEELAEAALWAMTSDTIDSLVKKCKSVIPKCIDQKVGSSLYNYIRTAGRHKLLCEPDIEAGIQNLVLIAQHFPISSDDQNKSEKALIQCVIAFMLASKAPLGEDVPFDNKGFHLLYANPTYNGGVRRGYCCHLKDFNREERRIFFKLGMHSDETTEKISFEELPYEEERDESSFKPKHSSTIL